MKKILTAVMVLVLSLFCVSSQAFATNAIPTKFGAVETNILTGCGSQDGEDSINCILQLVVDIMVIGVGILGVIGIMVVGIQYLTAGDNEEKTRVAKRRLFEIVIGLAFFAVMYAVLKFVLPSFTGP